MATLLLVSNNATVRRMVRLTFAREPVDVLMADDASAARGLLAERHPDVVLTELALSDASGYDLARIVGEAPAARRVPVLVLAGPLDRVDEHRMAEVDAAGVVAKPFEPEYLVAHVRRLLAYGKGALRHDVREGVPRLVQRLRASERAPAQVSAAAAPPAATSAPALASTPASTPASLDADFDRLDEAFSRFGSDIVTWSDAPRVQARDQIDDPSVPTLEALLKDEPRQVPRVETVEQRDMREELEAFFAPRPEPLELPEMRRVAPFTPRPIAVPPRRGLDEEMVETVTERVLARLSPDLLKDLVADVVSEVTERLVRQEMEKDAGQ